MCSPSHFSGFPGVTFETFTMFFLSRFVFMETSFLGFCLLLLPFHSLLRKYKKKLTSNISFCFVPILLTGLLFIVFLHCLFDQFSYRSEVICHNVQ